MKIDGRSFKSRKSKEGDEAGIRELFKICFGREMSYDEWLWKYKNSYRGTASVVTEYNGKIIGHYGGIRTNFYYKDKVFEAFQGCDAMTHPDFRGQGVLVKTALFFYEANYGSDFIFGFPSESHALISKKWLGWERHEFVCEMTKETIGSRFQWRKWKIEIGWDKIRAAEIDSLWEETKRSDFFSLIKKSDYIFWRYRDNPCKDYKLILYRGFFTGKLKGYAVINEQGEELQILDLIISKKSNFKIVIKLLEQKASAAGLKTIRIWLNRHLPEYSELSVGGFKEHKGIPYAVKYFKEPLGIENAFLNKYNYALGDYDAA